MTKKLIASKFLPQSPDDIAIFIHENLKILNLTNIGVLIGDIDEFAGEIRKHYIGQMNFRGFPLD